MAVVAPSNEVTRLVEALGLRVQGTASVTLRMAVNDVVTVNTTEYATGESLAAMAREIEDKQYRLTRWIPVGERLPIDQPLGYCLASDGTDVATANYDSIYGWSVHDREEWKPTHWMPLPEPPTDDATSTR